MNPGASMYMFHSVIQFDIDNEPRNRVDYQTPVKSVTEQAGKKFLWDRKEKKWIRQVVVSCNPHQN